jgi:hypothetical protein
MKRRFNEHGNAPPLRRQVYFDVTPLSGPRTFKFVLPAGTTTMQTSSWFGAGTTLYRLAVSLARWDPVGKAFTLDVVPEFKATQTYIVDLMAQFSGSPQVPLVLNNVATGLVQLTVRAVRGTLRGGALSVCPVLIPSFLGLSPFPFYGSHVEANMTPILGCPSML